MTDRRVVHLLYGLQASGMERMLKSSAPYWSQAGWIVHVVGQGHHHPYRDELEHAGYRVHLVRSVRSWRGLADWARLIHSTRVSVVHLHVESAYSMVTLATRLLSPRIRIVRTVHSSFDHKGRARWTQMAQRLLVRALGVTSVAPSTDVATNEMELWGNPCLVVESWVDDSFTTNGAESSNRPQELTGVWEEPLQLVMVGNCSDVKNHEEVLDALSRLTNVRLMHIGDEQGASNNERALLDSLSADGRLDRLGHRGDVPELLRRGDLFVMPSKREGLSVAAAEALCLGVPCMFSDVSGLKWARDLPGVRMIGLGDWARSLTELAGNHLEVTRLKKLAQEGAPSCRKRFAAERGVTQYLAVYQHSPSSL